MPRRPDGARGGRTEDGCLKPRSNNNGKNPAQLRRPHRNRFGSLRPGDTAQGAAGKDGPPKPVQSPAGQKPDLGPVRAPARLSVAAPPCAMRISEQAIRTGSLGWSAAAEALRSCSNGQIQRATATRSHSNATLQQRATTATRDFAQPEQRAEPASCKATRPDRPCDPARRAVKHR